MKTARILFVFMIATLFLLTACGGGAPAEPAPVVEQPPVTEPTVEPAPVEPTQAVEPAAPEPTQPQYAPFCDAALFAFRSASIFSIMAMRSITSLVSMGRCS